MNAKTISTLRQSLLTRQSGLQQELEHLEGEIRDLSIDQEAERGGAGNHFADDGSSLGEQERISIVVGDFRDQLLQIDQALARMDGGQYGICARCGKEIPVERLEALPFAAHCIECQSFLERQAELYGATAPTA